MEWTPKVAVLRVYRGFYLTDNSAISIRGLKLTIYDLSSHFIFGNNQIFGDRFLHIFVVRHVCTFATILPENSELKCQSDCCCCLSSLKFWTALATVELFFLFSNGQLGPYDEKYII